MSVATCASGLAAADCKTPSSVKVRDPIGRRIYIHEDSLAALAHQSEQSANLVLRMAARNVALKFVHHIEQDAHLFGTVDLKQAQNLVTTIESLWSENASDGLKQVGYRRADPRLRDDIHPILRQDEQIAATCYFSNYFTFATGDKTAELMFADTNDIASLKQIMQRESGYSDLTLINGINLVFFDSSIGFGRSKARAYFSRPSRLTKERFEEIKRSIYLETRASLAQVVHPKKVPTDSDGSLWQQVLGSLNNAFSRSMLKLPKDAFLTEGAQL